MSTVVKKFVELAAKLSLTYGQIILKAPIPTSSSKLSND